MQPIRPEAAAAEDPVPDLPCACATLRRATRAVSQLYAEEFDGLLEGPQFSLLANIDRRSGVTQSALGRLLVLDKTTLSRNLSLLKKNGWITLTPTGDKREHGVELTRSGRLLLEKARPAWQRAQQRLREALGESAWQTLFGVANGITRTARKAQRPAARTSPMKSTIRSQKGSSARS